MSKVAGGWGMVRSLLDGQASREPKNVCIPPKRIFFFNLNKHHEIRKDVKENS